VLTAAHAQPPDPFPQHGGIAREVGNHFGLCQQRDQLDLGALADHLDERCDCLLEAAGPGVGDDDADAKRRLCRLHPDHLERLATGSDREVGRLKIGDDSPLVVEGAEMNDAPRCLASGGHRVRERKGRDQGECGEQASKHG
jgi:hypothetical protein